MFNLISAHYWRWK